MNYIPLRIESILCENYWFEEFRFMHGISRISVGAAVYCIPRTCSVHCFSYGRTADRRRTKSGVPLYFPSLAAAYLTQQPLPIHSSLECNDYIVRARARALHQLSRIFSLAPVWGHHRPQLLYRYTCIINVSCMIISRELQCAWS